MRAKDFLMQYSKINKMIENKETEAAQWRAIATGTTSRFGTDRVQTSGNPDKMADAINKYVMLEQEIRADIDRLIRIKKDIISVLEQLKTPEYDLLHKVYIHEFQLKAVAAMNHDAYGNTVTAHGRALASVQKILNERERTQKHSN